MEEYVIEIPQKISELEALREKMTSLGDMGANQVKYVDTLLADIKAGKLRPAPEQEI